MRKKHSRRIGICLAAVMSLSLTACSSSGESGKGQTESVIQESKEQMPGISEEERGSGEEKEEAENAVNKDEAGEVNTSEENVSETGEVPDEDTALVSGDDGKTALPNPIREVESSKDFETIGLTLELPENEEWYSEVSYAVIGGKVAQISFYDEIAKSYALVRAGDEKEGDISGIYYNFDEKKKESWSTTAEDGTKIYITIQVTEKNADVHGALASWSYKGTSYSLWEDDARDRTDAVAKMAIEIAGKV